MMNILITICARGGSKGIPNKNIKILNGKPLIGYTINAAKKFADQFNADIQLSTDSEEIKLVAKSFGLESSYSRPPKLASDTAGKIDVIDHVLRFQEKMLNKRFDYILDMDVTSPLRTQEDLLLAFNQLKNDSNALNIFSVSEASRNPYFNMVEKKSNGYVGLIKSMGTIKSRQSAPKVYDMNASFYFFRRSFFNGEYDSSVTDKSLAYLMKHVCFDIDEPNDFIVMEFMMKNNIFNFSY